MKKHYATHVEDTDKLISVAGPILEYKTWYEQYKKLMEEQAQRKYGLYTPTSEGGDDFDPSSLKAVCSDGRIYLDDWSEVKNTQKQDASDVEKELAIGNNGSNFTKIAFKNLGIYNRILSKEDCIKAYNYLQTLKAK